MPRKKTAPKKKAVSKKNNGTRLDKERDKASQKSNKSIENTLEMELSMN